MTTEDKVEDRPAIRQTPIPIFETGKPSGKLPPDLANSFGKVQGAVVEKRFPWFGKFDKGQK